MLDRSGLPFRLTTTKKQANRLCRIVNGGFVLAVGALISMGAPLSRAQPANDLFANRIVIPGTNTVVTGSNVGATKQTGEPNHAGYSGGASVWWSWVAPSAGTVSISTAGSDFDTILGVYVGSSVSALTLIASNDDDSDTGARSSKVLLNVIANQTYQIAVDGYGGASGNVRLSVGPPPPPQPAPGWRLPDPNGLMISSTNYAGKVVIIDFWATWCGPCKAGMPDLVALQNKYRADGLVVVGANVSWSGENAQAVKTFLTTFTPTINYQIVMSDSATDNAFGGISAIPTTFIIDRQNIIRKGYVGTQTGSTLEQQIIPLLYANTRLGCQKNGKQMIFTWRTNAVAFTLQSTTSLVAPIWSAWPTAPTVVNGTNTVSVTTSGSPRYFRLLMTY